MRYEGNIFRPPSERNSLLLPITLGCSHNLCTFCAMYKDKKFKIRRMEDILEDICKFPEIQKPFIKRVFLIDGNPLIIGMEKLNIILDSIKDNFPNLERVGAYTTARDLIRFSVDDFKVLSSKKFDIVYIGVESGSDKILKNVKKDSRSKDILTVAPKLKEAGIKISTMILCGLGGKELIEENAIESAKVISEVNPEYLSLLTLMSKEGTQLAQDVIDGKFTMLSPVETLQETILFIENLNLRNTVFRTNHYSNAINIGGILNQDKHRILKFLCSIKKEEINNIYMNQMY